MCHTWAAHGNISAAPRPVWLAVHCAQHSARRLLHCCSEEPSLCRACPRPVCVLPGADPGRHSPLHPAWRTPCLRTGDTQRQTGLGLGRAQRPGPWPPMPRIAAFPLCGGGLRALCAVCTVTATSHRLLGSLRAGVQTVLVLGTGRRAGPDSKAAPSKMANIFY